MDKESLFGEVVREGWQRPAGAEVVCADGRGPPGPSRRGGVGSVLSAGGRLVTFIVFVRVVVESAGRLVHSFPGDAGCTERTGPGVLPATPSPYSCHPRLIHIQHGANDS